MEVIESDNINSIKTNYPGHSTFMRRPENPNIRANIAQAFLRNNPAVVFDFQFEHLNVYEKSLRSLLMQITQAYGANARSFDPFRLYFTSFKKDGKFNSAMEDRNINIDDLMVVDSEKSYLDLFPKEKLIYLSPNSKNEMQEVDEDKVYIIGVLSDEREKSPHTYNQARLEGIKTERFPIEKYVR
jgi:hypothetical protein